MGSSSSSAPAPHSWVTWLPSEPPHVTPLQAHTLVHCASVHSVQPNSRRAAFTSAQLVMLSLNPSRIWRSAGGERRQRGGKRKDEGSGSCAQPRATLAGLTVALTARSLSRELHGCLRGRRRSSRAAKGQAEQQQGCRQQSAPHAARCCRLMRVKRPQLAPRPHIGGREPQALARGLARRPSAVKCSWMPCPQAEIAVVTGRARARSAASAEGAEGLRADPWHSSDGPAD